MKKFALLALVVALCLSASAAFAAPKIGIMTGTVSQNEEEYRAGEEMVAKYGKDRVIHVAYPEKFMDEQETTMTQIAAMAADPEVKAIIVCQAVPGTAAGIKRVKEMRDDIVFILGTVQENPTMMAGLGDILFEIDQPSRGRSIVEKAKGMGAKTFVHYSFPRHMGMPLLAIRREIMEATCRELGMQFVFVGAPDPTGEGGLPAAQQFILEDLPRQVTKYGKDTAFFNTNCGMQEPMIRQVMATSAIYPEQCCPSPFHALPNALGIKVESKGDVPGMIRQITKAVGDAGMKGRVATWTAPIAMNFIRAASELGMEYSSGMVKDVKDLTHAVKVLRSYAGENIRVSALNRDGKTYPNFLMVVGQNIIF